MQPLDKKGSNNRIWDQRQNLETHPGTSCYTRGSPELYINPDDRHNNSIILSASVHYFSYEGFCPLPLYVNSPNEDQLV